MGDTHDLDDVDEIRYEGQGIDAEAVNRELADFWNVLQTDSEWRDEVRDAGIDLSAVAAIPQRDLIVVTSGERAANFDAITTAIIVKFAIPAAALVARDIWTKIILPRLETRYPSGSLKEKRKR